MASERLRGLAVAAGALSLLLTSRNLEKECFEAPERSK
jgi:hypothetical protein